ncbi:serpin family protein [Endozoicomonas sp. ISHI1]|uniref:serpin family protein n=1 Tax=Endozoicomonas sp. ISHI1 TaxID=2825882 RepID=UPI0021482ACE
MQIVAITNLSVSDFIDDKHLTNSNQATHNLRQSAKHVLAAKQGSTKHGSSEFIHANQLLSSDGETTMTPIGHSIKSISMSSQPFNLQDTHTGTTLQASDIAKKLIDKVSFGILNSEGKKSTVASPTSLTPVLGMLLACIDDNAKKESILGIPKGTLTEELETEIHKELGKFSKDNPYGGHPEQLISCANFIASAFHVRDEQLEKILSECYQTQKLESNQWNVAEVTEDFVKEKTKGKIKNLFDDMNEVTATIGNVMEFRGVWEDSFSPDKTAPQSFLCADGTRINNVKMMVKTETVQCASNSKFAAIAKEFKSLNGEDLKLVAIKPRKESATAINNLDSETINELTKQLNYKEAKYQLSLPKIKVEDSCDTQLLEKMCEALGTDIVAGDLTKLGLPADQDLEVLQKIVLSVDEEGASGKMATVAKILTRCVSGTSHFDFDCPGYIAIVDKEGNRLIELVIKDGSFLEFDGDPVISTAGKQSSNSKKLASSNPFDMYDSDDDLFDSDDDISDSDDDSSNNPFLNKQEEVQKNLSLIKDLSFRTFETVDVSTYINKFYNPNGYLDIQSADANNTNLTVSFSSLDSAKKFKESVLESIGEKNGNLIRVNKSFFSIEVYVSIREWDKMIDKITSESTDFYISDSKDNPTIIPAEKPSSDNLVTFNDYDMSDSEDDSSDSKVYTSDDQFTSKKEVTDQTPMGSVSTLIQQNYNPNGEFDIQNTKSDHIQLTLTMSSLEEAKKLRERILKSIGDKHFKFVRIFGRDSPFQLEVSFQAWDALREKLTFNQP